MGYSEDCVEEFPGSSGRVDPARVTNHLEQHEEHDDPDQIGSPVQGDDETASRGHFRASGRNVTRQSKIKKKLDQARDSQMLRERRACNLDRHLALGALGDQRHGHHHEVEGGDPQHLARPRGLGEVGEGERGRAGSGVGDGGEAQAARVGVEVGAEEESRSGVTGDDVAAGGVQGLCEVGAPRALFVVRGLSSQLRPSVSPNG